MRHFFLFLFFAFCFSTSYSQSKEQVYAGMILHIMKYVEWPNYDDAMYIGVVNDAQLTVALNKASFGKKIHFKNVSISKLNGVSGIEKTDVLFLPKNSINLLSQADAVAKKNKILVITDAKSNTNGTGINFFEEGGRMKFEIYVNTLEQVGFKISEQLLKFAIVRS